MFFIMENSEETAIDFFSKFCKPLIKMETQKIVNLLKSSENEYWYVIDSKTKGDYSHENPITFLIRSLESSLCGICFGYRKYCCCRGR